MNEKQTSKVELLSKPLRIVGRGARTFFVAAVLFFALSARNVEATPRQNPGCFDQCQANLASCLAAANGDPIAQFQCQSAYSACGELCMIG